MTAVGGLAKPGVLTPPLRDIELSLTGDSKWSLMWAAGAMAGLRDLGLLSRVSVISGTGVANIAVGFFLRALYRDLPENGELSDAWLRLTSPASPSTLFSQNFFEPLLDFCEEGTEGRMVRRRLCSPSRYFEPWHSELPAILDSCWDRFVWAQARLREPEHPIFVFNGRDVSKNELLSFTNDPRVPVRYLGAPYTRLFGPLGRQVTLGRLVAACALPFGPDASLLVDTSLGDTDDLFVNVGSSMEVDPLGLVPLQHYYLKKFATADEKHRDSKRRHLSGRLVVFPQLRTSTSNPRPNNY